MSLIGGWSLPSDPLYESSAATDAQTQLLAAHPQSAFVAVVQSSVRYAPISVPSTPARVASVLSSSVPCGAAASSRKSEQPYSPPPARTTNAVPKSSGCRDSGFIVSASLK